MLFVSDIDSFVLSYLGSKGLSLKLVLLEVNWDDRQVSCFDKKPKIQ